MKRIQSRLLLALFAGVALNAATVNTTLTVNASGTISGTNITVSGTATLTNIGNGTFSATVNLLSLGGTSISAPYTITLSGGTLTGTLSIPAALLTGASTSGTGSATVTGGTGSYAGATGSFPTLTGTGGITPTGSITLTFTGAGSITTGGTGGGGGGGANAPTVTAMQNNYSYILPGLPNYGIAPGALFIIKGTNLSNQPLSSLQSSAAPGLPKTLNGTSVAVTVNGTTTQLPIYYTSPSQLGVVLPSSVAVGNGTIVVTNAGTPGTATPIQVVKSALGLDTLLGSGTGAGVATDAGGNVFTPTSSAAPGQAIVLWGSGLGADTSNDDTTYPLKQNDLTSSLGLKVYIGGIQASIAYAGRSQYPGVDQVNVTIPTGVATGCSVSVVAVVGNIVSNGVTLPINPGGGACSDAIFGIPPGVGLSLAGKTTVNFGFVGVTQLVSGGTTTNAAAGIFESVSGLQFASQAGSSASIGSCIVNAPTVGTGSLPTINGLDAGNINLTGPTGSVALTTVPGFLGLYGAQLSASAIPASGGAFTFAASGKTVGPFTTTVNFPVPLVWTNSSSITSVNRANGVNVTWTGGGSGTYVQITGSSSANINGQVTSVGFTCNAPVSAGQFTVPPAVLLALPAGNGSLSLSNSTNPQTFTASGLDLGYAFAGTTSTISPPYN